jgi:hypothetical protein
MQKKQKAHFGGLNEKGQCVTPLEEPFACENTFALVCPIIFASVTLICASNWSAKATCYRQITVPYQSFRRELRDKMIQVSIVLSNTMQIAKEKNRLAGIASYFIDVPARVANEIGKTLEEELPRGLILHGVQAVVCSHSSVENGEAKVTLTLEVQNALELVERKIIDQLPGELQEALKKERIQARVTPDNC